MNTYLEHFKITIGLKIDLKNEKDFTKLYDVYVYIGHKGKRKYINTLAKSKLRNFNGDCIVGTPDAKRYNDMINETMADVKSRIRRIIAEHDTFSIDMFNDTTKDKEITQDNKKNLNDSFIRFSMGIILDMENAGTRKSYIATMNALKSHGVISRFKDLTVENILSFDKHLDKMNLADATINKYHKRIIALINRSYLAGYEFTSPYNIFRPRKFAATKLRYLEEEELQKIIDFKSNNKTLNRTRDLFVFQAFTGLSYADAIKVSEEDIKVIKGKKYIVDKRQKTLQEYAIRLYPESLSILERYNYDMDLLTNQAYNRFLKSLAVIVGVREDLTSHMARHTFATIALNRGVPLQIVAKMLGHSTSKCTEIYAQYLQGTIEREGYDKLEDIFG